LVELLIDRVIVTDSEVEIHYVIPTSPASVQIHFCHLRKVYHRHFPWFKANIASRDSAMPHH
jgi:hypothetical protein